METLPNELWDHIFSFLELPTEAAQVALVSHGFYQVAKANPRISSLLAPPRFDELESRDVLIGDDGYFACMDSEGGREGLWYPNDNANVAYVQMKAANGRATTAVHFLLDGHPSRLFCPSVALTSSDDDYSSWDRPVLFAANYFPDGDIHGFGYHAKPRQSSRTRYQKGDVITVQTGMRDLKTASRRAPGWRWVEEVDQKKHRYDNKYEVHPYVIFYKNFSMVYAPLVFPWLDEPLRIGVSFCQAGDGVRLMSPGMVPSHFKPLLPTGTPPPKHPAQSPAGGHHQQ